MYSLGCLLYDICLLRYALCTPHAGRLPPSFLPLPFRSSSRTHLPSSLLQPCKRDVRHLSPTYSVALRDLIAGLLQDQVSTVFAVSSLSIQLISARLPLSLSSHTCGLLPESCSPLGTFGRGAATFACAFVRSDPVVTGGRRRAQAAHDSRSALSGGSMINVSGRYRSK